MTLSHIFYTLQPYYANCIFPHWPIQRDNKDKSIIIINTKITFPYPCFCLLRLLGFTESLVLFLMCKIFIIHAFAAHMHRKIQFIVLHSFLFTIL